MLAPRPAISQLAALAISLLVPGLAPGEITLPPVFSNGMILQLSEKTPVWGTAKAGEEVTVAIGKASAKVVADSSGRWIARLDLRDIGYGPFDMSVAGENQLSVKDVLIGEVWFCSGQSNMDFKLDRIVDPKPEIASSTDPWLREFRIQWKASPTPLEAYTGRWIQASPATSAQFSAVAYFFGKQLRAKLQRPVGFLHASWGGTLVEAWISQVGAARDTTLATRSREMNADASTFPTRRAEYAKSIRAWENQAGLLPGKSSPEEVTAHVAPDANLSDWSQVAIIGNQVNNLAAPLEVLWLRRAVDLPPAMTGKKLTLLVNNISQFADIFWNGRRIGTINPATYTGLETSSIQDARHYFTIPESETAQSANTLAIRLYSLNGTSTIGPGHFRLEAPSGEHFYLEGKWMAQRQTAPQNSGELAASLPPAIPAPPQPQHIPSSLYNGMVHPLVPYGIAGFLWYQGEANVGQAAEYRRTFPLLITDWREQWQDPALPFYFCQLPNFNLKTSAPAKSAWAELRDAQAAALALPHTGQVITIDLGEAEDIHPREKKAVGDRLATLALSQTYGEKLAHAGPQFESMQVDGSEVRVRFATGGGSLVARPLDAEYLLQSLPARKAPLIANSPGSELQGFEIAGADGKWAFARARIDRSEVIVDSPTVPAPVAVRYAWADNPTVNLYNTAGYPAAPFSHPPISPEAAR